MLAKSGEIVTRHSTHPGNPGSSAPPGLQREATTCRCRWRQPAPRTNARALRSTAPRYRLHARESTAHPLSKRREASIGIGASALRWSGLSGQLLLSAKSPRAPARAPPIVTRLGCGGLLELGKPRLDVVRFDASADLAQNSRGRAGILPAHFAAIGAPIQMAELGHHGTNSRRPRSAFRHRHLPLARR
jgi:hypothetical protein